MGLNLDISKMLNLSNVIDCPNCSKKVKQNFDDFDIECGRPNPEKGIWIFGCYCPECDHEWEIKYKVNAERIE